MDDPDSLVRLAEARLAERAAKVAQQAAASGPKYCLVHQHHKWCNHNGGVRGVNGYGPPGSMSAADSMDDLIVWLRAQLGEDERLAAKEDDDYAHTTLLPTIDSDHQANWDTDRVRCEVEAKRRILDEVVPEINALDDRIESEWGTSGDALHDETWLLLKIMALPYADREGLREEWKP